MGGRTGGTQNQTSTTVLPPGQQQNVDTLMRDSLAYYQGGGPKYFEGSTVAPTDPNQTAGRQAAVGYATGAGQELVNGAQAANNRWLDPNVLTNYSSIPGYDAARQGIITGATQTLSEGVLPGLRDDAIMSGNYGGTGHQIGEALATSRTNEGIAAQLGNLDLGLYNTNAGMQNNAIARSGQMYNLGLMPGQTQEQVGGLNRADAQQNVDADVQRWNFEQMAPLMNLQALQSLTGTAGQYGGTTSTHGTQGGTDGGAGLMQFAGMAIMALAMY